MITEDQKRQLRDDYGYTDDQIAQLTPQEAHDILGTGSQSADS